MEIKKAKLLVEDILDICTQLGEENLNDSCSGIYNDLQVATSVEQIVLISRELMIFVGDSPWDEMDGGEDLKNEIEKIFNELIEEFEEF